VGLRRRAGKSEGERRCDRRDGQRRPHPEAIGGFCVVDVGLREEALEWAAKTAVACRCAQEVHEFMPDSTVGQLEALAWESVWGPLRCLIPD
jgi:hypothetical protein